MRNKILRLACLLLIFAATAEGAGGPGFQIFPRTRTVLPLRRLLPIAPDFRLRLQIPYTIDWSTNSRVSRVQSQRFHTRFTRNSEPTSTAVTAQAGTLRDENEHWQTYVDDTGDIFVTPQYGELLGIQARFFTRTLRSGLSEIEIEITFNSTEMAEQFFHQITEREFSSNHFHTWVIAQSQLADEVGFRRTISLLNQLNQFTRIHAVLHLTDSSGLWYRPGPHLASEQTLSDTRGRDSELQIRSRLSAGWSWEQISSELRISYSEGNVYEVLLFHKYRSLNFPDGESSEENES